MPQATIAIQTTLPKINRILKTLIQSGLEAADPGKSMKQEIIRKDNQLCVNMAHYDLSQFQRVICVGAGKASAHMARTLEQILGNYLEGGMVIVKDGYEAPTKKIQVIEAGHPLPDSRGVRATKNILTISGSLTKHDLLIVLLSGGASSLLCAPAPGLTLTNTRKITKWLLQSGATIHELNTVRKHLSAIKGGQLAKTTKAQILTIIVSDVMGDDLATIGSGPTVPDPSTFHDAQAILKQYQIWNNAPERVRTHLEQGIDGHLPETWKSRRQHSPRNRSIILANNHTAINGISLAAKRLGLRPSILDSPFQGEAKDLGSILGAMAKDIREFGNPIRPPGCLIAGGEPTVTVTGKGKGGRAQETVLAAAQEIAGLHNVFVAGFGTDGTDGPTDVAGALVDGLTIEQAAQKGIDVSQFLNNNDSYNFFKKVGGHIITGPTNTNVNDIYLVLVL